MLLLIRGSSKEQVSPFKIIIIVMVLIAIVAVFIACVQDVL